MHVHPCLCVATLGSSRHVLISSVAVVTGIVISISKQEYMFEYKVTSISKQEYMFEYKVISISKQEYMFEYKVISISKQEYMFEY
jgi:L-asparagine transporter-like permease